MKYAGYLLAVAAAAFLFCSPNTLSTDYSGKKQTITVMVFTQPQFRTCINPLTLRVSGDGLNDLLFDETPENAFGNIEVPAGIQLKFMVEGHGQGGILTDSGSTTVSIDETITAIAVQLYAAIAPPVITSQPHDITTNQGNRIVFSIEASGEDLHYIWKELSPEGGSRTLTNNDSLVIDSAVDSHVSGVRYQCEVFNSAGWLYSDTACTIVFGTTPGPDTVPPVLQLRGDAVMLVRVGTPFVDPGASAYDLHDGALNEKIIVTGTVNTDFASTCTLTYSVSDSAGNTGVIKRVVVVYDFPVDQMPIVLSVGDTIVIPEGKNVEDCIWLYADSGIPFSELGNVEPPFNNIKSQLFVIDSVTWRVEYKMWNSIGTTVYWYHYFVRKHAITQSIDPLIDLVYGDSIIIVPKGTRWVDPGYRAVDPVDGDITNKVIVDSIELVANLNNPGDYTVTYTVTNSFGLSYRCERHVKVVYTIVESYPPVITLKGRNPDTVQVASAQNYTDPGYIAIDARDGDVTVNVMCTGSVDLNTAGTYTLTYTVVDASGNRSITKRTIVVVLDTLDSDLRHFYKVPSEDPLPTIMSKDFTAFSAFGEAPDLTLLQRLSVSWKLEQNTLQSFFLAYTAEPHFVDISSIEQTFGSSSPSMKLTGTHLPGLDGEYYVAFPDEGSFVWVEKSGKFAIVWKE